MTSLGYNVLLELVCGEFVFNHNGKAIQLNYDHKIKCQFFMFIQSFIGVGRQLQGML